MRENTSVENSDTQYICLTLERVHSATYETYLKRQIKMFCASALSYPPAVILPVNVLRL